MARKGIGNDSANTRTGTSGDDILSGIGGSFNLIGGKGNDLYIIDDSGDTIDEKNNGGTDHVVSYVDFVLGNHIEDLTLAGDASIGTGNDSNNTITGNSNGNTLDGRGGDDTLIGGDGTDFIDGGDGIDTAVFTGASGDYVIIRDGLDLLVMLNGGATDTLRNVEYLSFDDGVIAVSDIGDTPGDLPLPVAIDDAGGADEDGSVVITVLGNDIGDGIVVTSATDGTKGLVTINADGTVTYQPVADANGTDSFTYSIADSLGRTATATVSVDIASLNDAPVANADSYSVVAGEVFTSPGSVLDNDMDADGDVLVVVAAGWDSDADGRILASIEQGTSQAGGTVLMGADGSFTYAAPAGFTGTDKFIYTISDGNGGYSNATVSISVGSSGGVPDYALEALLPGGTGDSIVRWNYADPLGTAVTVTYSFLTDVPDYYSATDAERSGFRPFDEAQQTAVREALALIESFTNITFVETSDTVGQITFGMADLPSGVGWAYSPSSLSPKGGDVWLDSLVADNLDLTQGGDGFKNLLHEIGHALGLQHPQTSSEYPSDELNRKYTVMATAQHPDMVGAEPANYMPYDIAALQHLYGSDFMETAGDDVYDISNVDGLLTTIWDGGGWDILDASNSTRAVILDLNPGAYSTSGTSYGWYPAADNIALAFGTIIEEARGGTGDDVIIGSSYDNRMSGGTGSDRFVLSAGWGADVIGDFEDGIDVIDLSATPIGFGDLAISESAGSAVITFEDNTLTLAGISVADLDSFDFLLGVAG